MNLNFLFGYQNNAQAAGTSAGGENGVFQATGPPADMTAFKAGQTVQGEVVAVRNNEVILQLEDGSQINAKLTKDIPINIGQSLTFEVKSNNGSRLSLSPLFENMGHDPNVLKALKAAGMPDTARNLEMVSLLMREGMAVDKNSLYSFSRQMAVNPGTSPAVLAQMTRLSVPVTAENIKQFQAYQNYEHQISSAVREITDGLIKDIGQMVTNGDSDGAVALFKQVLSIFGGDGFQAGAGSSPNAAPLLNIDPFLNTALQGNEGAAVSGGQVNTLDAVPMVSGDDILRMIGEQVKAEGLADSVVTAGESGLAQNQSGVAAQADIVSGNVLNPEQSAIVNLVTALSGEEAGVFNAEQSQTVAVAATQADITQAVFISLMEMAPENREQLAVLLREAGFSSVLTEAVNTGMLNQETLVSMLHQELGGDARRIDMAKLAELFNNKDFQALLKNDINNQWLLKPEDLVKERQVGDHFKKVFEQTARLIEALNSAGRGETQTASAAVNLNSNINFINQLNQVFTYVQIPLKMNGENTHGELFIYTNKKNLAKSDGNVSALLHLDMEHLGPIDIYVAMQNKNVSTKFYLANEAVLDLIGKHISVLDERLRERGYNMSSEFIGREVEKGPVDEILEANRNFSVIASYSFDARA